MIKVENVNKSYGEHAVLRNLSHHFPKDRVTWITGASGCGKTTLLRLILGLESPDSGRILGVPSGAIGCMFQEDRLLHGASAYTNLQSVQRRGAYTRAAIENALQSVGLEGCADQPVDEMSGGMRRRIALLRALLIDTELIVLDEPFKGLDEATKVLVRAFTAQRLQNKTALIVTHDEEDIRTISGEILQL